MITVKGKKTSNILFSKKYYTSKRRMKLVWLSMFVVKLTLCLFIVALYNSRFSVLIVFANNISKQPNDEVVPTETARNGLPQFLFTYVVNKIRNVFPSITTTTLGVRGEKKYDANTILNNVQESRTTSIGNNSSSKAVMVGVYYYPWYGDDNFHGHHYLRETLVPPQYPQLGEYNDRDSDVIEQHIQWSLEANIQIWISSWWGPNSMTDETLLHNIMTNEKFQHTTNLQLAILYETEGRLAPNFSNLSRIEQDIKYLALNYFDHPNYLRIDNKPVVVIYLTRVLGQNGNLHQVIQLMRDSARDAGAGELFLIGDHVFRSPPEKDTSNSALQNDNDSVVGSDHPSKYDTLVQEIQLLDAITNYDVYGSVGASDHYATHAEVDAFYEAQHKWQILANSLKKGFVPVASPGYNDRVVRLEVNHKALSRKLNHSASDYGSLFRTMLQHAMALVDSSAQPSNKMLFVTSFNEWHEDTQIEPIHITSSQPSSTNVDNSTTGDMYCQHIEYEGYGTLYLDILRNETTTFFQDTSNNREFQT